MDRLEVAPLLAGQGLVLLKPNLDPDAEQPVERHVARCTQGSHAARRAPLTGPPDRWRSSALVQRVPLAAGGATARHKAGNMAPPNVEPGAGQG